MKITAKTINDYFVFREAGNPPAIAWKVATGISCNIFDVKLVTIGALLRNKLKRADRIANVIKLPI